MKKALFSALVPVLLFSADTTISFDLNGTVPLDILQSSLPKGVIVDNKELLRSEKERVYFAKKFVSSISSKEKQEVKNELLDILYRKELQKLFNVELKNIGDDVIGSYYTLNKDKFKTSETIDLFVVMFSDEKNASDYDIDKNQPVPMEVNEYKNYQTKELNPNFMFLIDNLKENELSSVYKKDDKFIRIYFKNKNKSRILPLKDVKDEVIQILFNKKKSQLLKSSDVK